jgi:Plasmid encoded RepA protein
LGIDTRALKALTRSPLAIDLYVWLMYRMSYLREPTTMPWELLALQTGAHYREVRQFRRRALEALPKVAAVYPAARVKPAADEHGRPLGLELTPSPTHVRHRPRST